MGGHAFLNLTAGPVDNPIATHTGPAFSQSRLSTVRRSRTKRKSGQVIAIGKRYCSIFNC